ncbi:hypothetical protein SAM23877_7221 [Streptomyces ambofaciens ATCC 23877]|uniref:Uncharacterized protein n=1 Tax=Streptomyces ambofaciens (strain ATCC 23877 / 3486 / DSM 40053 / JCM 4204 / NBRC 12836 / NRRL B-2516) TaxID=278992 RepID=A0A0K2B4Q7_STRA7|nr:hypothetical protein SAM23877_7221 [Streptomyces ambofaciens ATCC 23877]
MPVSPLDVPAPAAGAHSPALSRPILSRPLAPLVTCGLRFPLFGSPSRFLRFP